MPASAGVSPTLAWTEDSAGADGELGIGSDSGRGDVEVPEGVARELRTCAGQHSAPLPADHSIRFDVKRANHGQFDEVSLRISTLADEGLEAWRARARRLLAEDELVLRRHAEARPRGPVALQARALLGQEEAAFACLASPPCGMTLGFVAGFASLSVGIDVHASPRPGLKTHAPPAVTTPPAVSVSPLPPTSAPPMPPMRVTRTLSDAVRDAWAYVPAPPVGDMKVMAWG